MTKVILIWFLLAYTALSGYSFVYAVTIKPEERDLQGPIQKILYWNALFVTGLLFGAAVAGLVILAGTALFEASNSAILGPF